MAVINRNGKTYDSGDVEVTLFGQNDFEVTAISYGSKQAHTANYSLGTNKATSYSMGKIENEGSITFRLPSLAKIQKAAGGDILRIKPFSVSVSFVNDDNELVTDVLTAKFTENKREANGDEDLKVECPLFILDIDWWDGK